jgi:HEAT repeat protein
MLEETLKSVQAYDWGQSRTPLLEMDREIRKVQGHPELLAKLEIALLELLKSDAPPGAKRYVCQKLSLIGSEQSIPVLAALLTSDNADIARYALERIPGEAVNQALRDGLPKAEGKAKVGIIDSLGARKDAQAVAPLGKLLDDSNPTIAAAAAWALGQIGGPEAGTHLAAMKDSANPQVRPVILDAWLSCAERMQADGKTADAVTIYTALNAENMPSAVRKAAARGLTSIKG